MTTLRIVAAVSALLQSYALYTPVRSLEFLAKPTVMLALMLHVYNHDPSKHWWLLGMFMCLLGDICLLFIDQGGFLFGLVSFLLGHVCYVVAIGELPSLASFYHMAVGASVCLVTVFVMRPIVSSLQQKKKHKLIGPVLCYGVVIATMVIAAIQRGDSFLLALGAVTFYISDVILATHRFVQPIQHGRVWNIGVYHLSQIMIAMSLTA